MTSDKSRDSDTPGDSANDADEDSDSGLFRKAVRGARPIERDYVAPPPRRFPARARFARRDEEAVLDEILDAPSDSVIGDGGEYLEFHRDGVGGRPFRNLRRGRYSIQDEFDLHGLSVADARDGLKLFLESALGRGHTCVRVIHGKGRGSGHGGPILKRKVDGWLRQWDAVLAFCSALPADGGTGAVYVLLKRL